MEQSRKSELKFEWKIENFSHFSQIFGEFLDSPVFVRHVGQTTKWCVRLYPKGSKHENMLSLFLKRLDSDAGHLVPVVGIRFSINATDGSSINDTKDTCIFNSLASFGFPDFTLLNGIFREKMLYLPNDTLTIVCSIWEENDGKVHETCARSRIQVHKTTFEGSVNNFSIIKTSDTREIFCTIVPLKPEFPMHNINLFLSRFSNERTLVLLQASKVPGASISSCEIHLVDSSHNLVNCGKYQNVDIITLSLSKEDILSRGNDYLPNDTLTLCFEIVYSFGATELHRIEAWGPTYYINHQKDVGKYEKINDIDEVSGLKNDLYSFFQKGVMCDKILTTPTKSFPVHSVVLSARCSFFQNMFSSDMKKKGGDTVPISGINDDVLESLLQFIYLNTVNNLQWDLAIELYKAADMYQIDLLKKKCALFLKRNLKLENVREILYLADLHFDTYLMGVVENFIDMHKHEVIRSPGWKQCEEEKPWLAIKILRNLCLK